ncbi:MAG: ABC transporter ATP-binding protein [Clostridia bacterium]|nr:ABC transporter ATP-binding protein [Clostridia bacterium]
MYIKIEGLNFKYKNATEETIIDFNGNIEKGEIISIIGQSGSGKSTVLRLIAGLETPKSGSIKVNNKIMVDDNTFVLPEKREIGMVFQDYALFPHMTIEGNVKFGLKDMSRKEKDERSQEVLELVGLKDYKKRYPYELSGGQQQRVALARALAPNPALLLLDEPFSNLDADLRIHMRLEVKRIIKEAGATAVFVTHDQKDALAISDRIIVMKDGLVQQNGTPREIYQFPENKFVATFVGQSNILEGKIGADGNSVVTELGVIPCSHTHSLAPGEPVYISIRPDSLEMDENGNIEGRIKQSTYTGDAIDAIVEVTINNGYKQDLLVHVHPEETVNMGDLVRFKILPHFVAVIKHD